MKSSDMVLKSITTINAIQFSVLQTTVIQLVIMVHILQLLVRSFIRPSLLYLLLRIIQLLKQCNMLAVFLNF